MAYFAKTVLHLGRPGGKVFAFDQGKVGEGLKFSAEHPRRDWLNPIGRVEFLFEFAITQRTFLEVPRR
jgi:hypothetical protein